MLAKLASTGALMRRLSSVPLAFGRLNASFCCADNGQRRDRCRKCTLPKTWGRESPKTVIENLRQHRETLALQQKNDKSKACVIL